MVEGQLLKTDGAGFERRHEIMDIDGVRQAGDIRGA